jgi:hypothetical protein
LIPNIGECEFCHPNNSDKTSLLLPRIVDFICTRRYRKNQLIEDSLQIERTSMSADSNANKEISFLCILKGE